MHVQRRSQKAGFPAIENCSDLISIFFQDEGIEPGLHFQERCIEGTFIAIVRMKLESGGRKAAIGSECELGNAEAPES